MSVVVFGLVLVSGGLGGGGHWMSVACDHNITRRSSNDPASGIEKTTQGVGDTRSKHTMLPRSVIIAV